MADYDFLTWEELLQAHTAQLQEHGGQDGFIDEGIIRSVLSRAQFTAQYNEGADVADLAADYMYGLATTKALWTATRGRHLLPRPSSGVKMAGNWSSRKS